MAFTLEQKYSIVFALCHPAGILVSSNVNYNSVFNDRLNGLDEIAEQRAIELVEKLNDALKNLENSPKKSNVKRIDDIELDTTISLSLIKKEVNRLRNELSQLLDVPNNCKGSSCVVKICH